MKKYRLGYTQGVYDLFHIGHLNLINNAKQMCEYLIVGINSDKLVEEYKHKKPIIDEINRSKIVMNLKAVDEVIIVDTLDKLLLQQKLGFDAVFIGSDWKGNDRWLKTENDLAKVNCDVIYLPHTDGISTTMLKEIIKK